MLLPFSKIMPKTLHRSKSKIWSSTYFFFSSFVCVYTNKYNILCRFYVVLFVHFYIKKYNSVPFYFMCIKNLKVLGLHSTTQHHIAIHSSGHDDGQQCFPIPTYILVHTFNTTTISKLTLLQ